MEISVNVGYFAQHISSETNLISELDELGISSIWTPEAYAYDAEQNSLNKKDQKTCFSMFRFCLLYTSPSQRD